MASDASSPVSDTKVEQQQIEKPEDARPAEDRVGFLTEEGRAHLVTLLNAGARVQLSGCLPMLGDGYEMAKAFKYFTDPAFDPQELPPVPEGADALHGVKGAPDKAKALIGVAIRIAVLGQAPKDRTSAYTIHEVYPVVEAIRYFTTPSKTNE